VGKRAEELARKYIQEHAVELKAKNIRWVAQEGLTPGWDLQYENENGEMIVVEVKGTAGPMFGGFDITVGEWNAARIHQDRYWLYLVADCSTVHAEIERIQNPAKRVDDGQAQLLPVVFRFSALAPQSSPI
jgi:hypothetical protein